MFAVTEQVVETGYKCGSGVEDTEGQVAVNVPCGPLRSPVTSNIPGTSWLIRVGR